MVPYASFSYFAMLLYPVVPTLALGWLGRFSRYWLLFVTVAALVVQYGANARLLPDVAIPVVALVAAYALYQYALARVFLALRRGKSRPLFWTAVLASLAPLLAVKLAPLAGAEALVGFLGISYVTFRALDVVVGIADGLITQLSPTEYFTFLLFFPAISSGPIDRYRRFARDWNRSRSRAEFLADLDTGIHKIFIGFLYKFIAALLIKQYWLDPAAAGAGLDLLSYMYAYSLYLFFDFAGYSLFAVGVSYLFGIHTPDNFHRPFAAGNIQEFWNRWHMTLSFWFRDHIYARFLMAAARGKWFRSRALAGYVGLALTFVLMGAWHGLALHYLIYGAYHAVLLVAHTAFARWNESHHLWGNSLAWRIAGVVLTFHLVCFGFLIFSGRLG